MHHSSSITAHSLTVRELLCIRLEHQKEEETEEDQPLANLDKGGHRQTYGIEKDVHKVEPSP